MARSAAIRLGLPTLGIAAVVVVAVLVSRAVGAVLGFVLLWVVVGTLMGKTERTQRHVGIRARLMDVRGTTFDAGSTGSDTSRKQR